MADKVFFFGDWQVDPAANSVRRGDTLRALEPKAMDVLRQLCQQAGEVVCTEELLQRCWPGEATGDNPLHKAINQLRRALDCDSAHPSYIETIRKRGYRAIAPVQFPIGEAPPLPAAEWRGGSPFPGLRAFGEADADVFFGRGEAISAVLRSLSRLVAAGRGLCLVLGPSGSGKTSLIAAGVLPNLMTARGYDGLRLHASAMLDLALSQPDRLLLDIASALLDWELNDAPAFAGYSAERLAEALRADPAAVFASLTTLARPDQHSGPLFALFIDRLEAVFADTLDETRRMQLFRLLDAAAGSGAVLVLLTCRNDFYPQVSRYPLLMDGKAGGSHFDLQPPTRQEWLQMIRLPARAAQLQWQLDEARAQPLDELLCSEASQNPDALPMLQYTLQELYLQRGSDNLLRAEVYHALGGIEGAIGRQADAVLNSLADGPRVALPAVLSLLVTLGADEITITSRSARWQELADADQRQLVQAMVDQRLFVSGLQGGEPVFAVAHEALLRRWPRALDWIASQRESLKVHARVLRQAQRWQEEQRNSERLLASGRPLLEAESLLTGALPVDDTTRAFIAASGAGARKRRRMRRGIIVTLSLLSVISLAMGWRAWQSEQVAQQKRAEAEGLMGFMVGDLADKLRQIGRMDLLDGVSSKALDYLRREGEASDEPTSLTQQAKALLALGEVAYNRGKVDEAQQAFASAEQLFFRLQRLQPTHTGHYKDAGAAAFWGGQLAFDSLRWADAERHFRVYLGHAETMRKLAPNDVDGLIEEAYAHNSLGSVTLRRGDIASAIDQFQLSIRLKQQAREQRPDDRTLATDLADSLGWLASTYRKNGQLDYALRLHQQAQGELEGLRASAPQEPGWTYRLTLTLAQQAEVLDDLGELDRALLKWREAAELLHRSLQQDPDNTDWQIDLLSYETSIQYGQLVSASTTAQRPAAEALLKKIETLHQHVSTDRSKRLLLSQQLQVVEVQLLDGAFEAAKQSLSHALTIITASEASLDERLYIPSIAEALYLMKQWPQLQRTQYMQQLAGQLQRVVAPELVSSRDPDILAAWTIGQLSLLRPDAAARAQQQLQEIGFRKRRYLQQLVQLNETRSR